jgi:hypothetical protein
MPEGAPPMDLPPQPAVFAPDYSPDDIAGVAERLREASGLPKQPTGVVANDLSGVVGKVKEKLT